MSANVDTMMYVQQVPWHGIGTKLDQPATAALAIAAAQLDWEVAVRPLAAIMSPDELIRLTKSNAVVRLDTKQALGVVGNRYTPVQNKEAFSFFDSVVGAGQAIYHVAGALGQGETIWILAKLPGHIRVGKTDDLIEKYLLLTNTHNGTTALRMFFTPIRVVCQNTLSMALGSASGGLSIRHYPDILQNVKQAQDVLGLANTAFTKMNEKADALAAAKVTPTWLEQYVETLFPILPGSKLSTHLQKVRADVTATFDSPANLLPGIAGTAWAAYNAVTEYVDHKKNISKAKNNPSRRLNSIWLGDMALLKEKALELALTKIGV